jgi:predicted RNA methylase
VPNSNELLEVKMTFATIARKLSRATSVYQEGGLAAILSRLARRVRRLIGRGDPRHQQWIRYKSDADIAFDTAHGTKTGGIEEIYGYQIVGNNARHGLSHIASDPALFPEMMAGLKIDFATFTFIDLGSGKGRALMLAAAYPFRRIVGVEFAAELHRAAEANLAALARIQSPDMRIELVHGDAAAYELPSEPLIIYLFNPFGSVIVRRVAEKAMASWQAIPRPMYVLYANPYHLSDFIEAGWQLYDQKEVYARLVPPTQQ